MILEQSEAAYKVKITQQIHEGKSFLMKCSQSSKATILGQILVKHCFKIGRCFR
jgi:hypothetical protein